MRRYLARASSLFLGAVLTLAFAEVGLRIAASVEDVAPKTESGAGAGDSTIKILTVGESTTAPFPVLVPGAAGDVSWPQQLERRLNSELETRQSKFRVQVENLGRAGVSSAFLVDDVRKRLEAETVDVVISMMGVNDAWAIIPESRFWYRHSYVGRFLYWAFKASSCPACFRTGDGAPQKPRPRLSNPQHAACVEYSKALAKNPFESSSDFEKNREAFQKLSPKMGPGAFPAAVETGWALFDRSRVSKPGEEDRRRELSAEALRFLEPFREDVIHHDNALVMICYVTMPSGDACLKFSEEAFAKGHVPSDTLLTLLVSQGAIDSSKQLRDILEARGFAATRDIKSLEGIRRNYRRLGELVKSHGVLWMAMQYPTGTTAGLRWLMTENDTEYERFSDIFYLEKDPTDEGLKIDPLFQDVSLISNRNFTQLAQGASAEKYFRDFFARSGGLEFGHTTEAGYKLITDNVMKEFVPRLAEIESRYLLRHQANDKPTEP